MKILSWDYRVLTLSLSGDSAWVKAQIERYAREVMSQDFITIEKAERIILTYKNQDVQGALPAPFEYIKVRVLPLQINRSELEIVCRPTASIPKAFLRWIADQWSTHKEFIDSVILESEKVLALEST